MWGATEHFRDIDSFNPVTFSRYSTIIPVTELISQMEIAHTANK